MKQYAVFLGHQPSLSIAELAAVLPGFRVDERLSRQLALCSAEADITQETLDRLGGTVAIAEHIADVKDVLSEVPALLQQQLSKIKTKVTFGFRAQGVLPDTLRQLYRNCKERLRNAGKPCRYVGNERRAAPTILLHQAEMVSGKGGAELVLLALGGRTWVGRTVAVQDIESYTERDTGKPARDMREGFLPPKLAQIMLNFGEWLVRGTPAPETKKKLEPLIVLDPFCGMGVIPMETILRGWTALGSDVSLKAVNAAEKNLDWLRKEREIFKKDVPSTLWKQDATKPFELKVLPNVVVSETYLGPALDKPAPKKDAAKWKTEAEKLQAAFLSNAAATLPGVPLVLTWPVWVGSDGELTMLEKSWEAASKLGYMATLPPFAEASAPGRFGMLYRRPDQFVGREVVLLLPRRK